MSLQEWRTKCKNLNFSWNWAYFSHLLPISCDCVAVSVNIYQAKTTYSRSKHQL